MTDEQMQHTIQFILEQQSQFVVNMQKLQEAQIHTETQVAEVAEAQAQTARAQTQAAQVQTHLVRLVGEMVEAQSRTDSKLAETDEPLNALINTVERYISEGRNGKKQDENSDS